MCILCYIFQVCSKAQSKSNLEIETNSFVCGKGRKEEKSKSKSRHPKEKVDNMYLRHTYANTQCATLRLRQIFLRLSLRCAFGKAMDR